MQRVDGRLSGGPTARGCANSFHVLFISRCCTLARRSGCDANKRPRESVTVARWRGGFRVGCELNAWCNFPNSRNLQKYTPAHMHRTACCHHCNIHHEHTRVNGRRRCWYSSHCPALCVCPSHARGMHASHFCCGVRSSHPIWAQTLQLSMVHERFCPKQNEHACMLFLGSHIVRKPRPS
jgi:hypothetical protein